MVTHQLSETFQELFSHQEKDDYFFWTLKNSRYLSCAYVAKSVQGVIYTRGFWAPIHTLLYSALTWCSCCTSGGACTGFTWWWPCKCESQLSHPVFLSCRALFVRCLCPPSLFHIYLITAGTPHKSHCQLCLLEEGVSWGFQAALPGLAILLVLHMGMGPPVSWI